MPGSGQPGSTPPSGRARARDLGLAPGTLLPGPANAITDVPGIRVGHATVIEGTDVRTGVTAIVPDRLVPEGRMPPETMPAGLSVFNGFGKITGSTQIAELGTIETPVLLTATLSVFRVADALLTYLRELRGGEQMPGTLNPVVAETNDSFLSDIWARPITAAHVRAALDSAAAGPVAEGCVGAGTGTGALGFKAGIGTSSRLVPLSGGPVTLGSLVQANFGGVLTVLGVPVPHAPDPGPPRGLGSGQNVPGQQAAGCSGPPPRPGSGHEDQPPPGSCVIVLATDAPLDARRLERVASRAFAGMARTGSNFSGNSGDYALAISTAPAPAAPGAAERPAAAAGSGLVSGDDLDLLFQAAIEATEEAILNSVFTAETTTGFRGHIRHAVSLDSVLQITGGKARNGRM
jgi:D-aminopeptidase